MKTIIITLSGREVAILGAVLSRCLGWDDPCELERFLNVASECIGPDGFTEPEMTALQEKLSGAWIDGDKAWSP